MGVIENGGDLLGHGTLKSSANDLMNWGDFLDADINSGKLKVSLIVIG